MPIPAPADPMVAAQTYTAAFSKALEGYHAEPESEVILIVGPTGSGKTMSLDSLPRESTVYLNYENKPQPFRVPFKLSLRLPMNVKHGDKGRKDSLLAPIAWREQIDMIRAEPSLRYVAIDSFNGYSDESRIYCQAEFSNYAIWEEYSSSIWDFVKCVKNLPGKTVVVTCRDEIVRIDMPNATSANRARVAVHGKFWEKLSFESQFTHVLWTLVKPNASGTMEYLLQRNTDGINSAKTPDWVKLPKILTNNNVLSYIEALSKGRS